MIIQIIAEKTAIKILQDYSLEDLLNNPDLIHSVDNVTKKIKTDIYNDIIQNKDFILLMNTMVKMKTNIHLDCNLRDFIKKEKDHEKYNKIINQIGLNYNIDF